MKLPLTASIVLLAASIAACGQQSETREAATEAEAPAATEAPAEGPIEDIAAARPDVVSVAFENEYVRVLRFDLEPNEALPPHSGARRVVYALSDYEVDWMEGGEDIGRRAWEAGAVHAHDAGVHAIENTGATTASFVVFERSDRPLPSTPAAGDDAGLPEGARALLSAADLEVLEITLEPGEGQSVHDGGWRAIYSLGDYTIEWQEGDELTETSWSAGDVHWHEPGPHAATNAGDSVAQWLVVGFRN